MLQLVGIRDNSPALMTTGPARPPALGVDGHEGVVLGLPHTHPQGWLTFAFVNRVNSAWYLDKLQGLLKGSAS